MVFPRRRRSETLILPRAAVAQPACKAGLPELSQAIRQLRGDAVRPAAGLRELVGWWRLRPRRRPEANHEPLISAPHPTDTQYTVPDYTWCQWRFRDTWYSQFRQLTSCVICTCSVVPLTPAYRNHEPFPRNPQQEGAAPRNDQAGESWPPNARPRGLVIWGAWLPAYRTRNRRSVYNREVIGFKTSSLRFPLAGNRERVPSITSRSCAPIS
ncbi:hypothetical protein VTK56DRAFT_5991 [Thermocarpiscus australiensis]